MCDILNVWKKKKKDGKAPRTQFWPKMSIFKKMQSLIFINFSKNKYFELIYLYLDTEFIAIYQ